MKITEYTAATSLSETDAFVVETSAGTRQIKSGDLQFALTDVFGPQMHRNIFRGKNLGTSVTSTQQGNIQSGNFTDLWLGDYWVINGVNWRIVDFDYWYGLGDTACDDHHVVIMPDSHLYTATMNDTSVTTGGYVGSKMYTTNLTQAKTTITQAFGDKVLSHREFLINAVTSGYASAGTWYDSTVELPNEIMMFGCSINATASDGSGNVKCYTNSKVQLALMALCPQYIKACWLRDVVSSTYFARIDSYGGATATGGANAYGVRPVFAIK